MDEFSSVLVPRADSSLSKLTHKRKNESEKVENLEYGVQFAVQKLLLQVIEAEVRLEAMCKFSFESGKVKSKRLDADNLGGFLKKHGRHPYDGETELILGEINRNKGAEKRNRQISDYIAAFNQSIKGDQSPPTLTPREPMRFERSFP